MAAAAVERRAEEEGVDKKTERGGEVFLHFSSMLARPHKHFNVDMVCFGPLLECGIRSMTQMVAFLVGVPIQP